MGREYEYDCEVDESRQQGFSFHFVSFLCFVFCFLFSPLQVKMRCVCTAPGLGDPLCLFLVAVKG